MTKLYTMEKKELETIKDLYDLLDDVYDIIEWSDSNKAIYSNKEEQYKLQTSTFELPTEYPCVITYYLDFGKYKSKKYEHLNNKKYCFLHNVNYTIL